MPVKRIAHGFFTPLATGYEKAILTIKKQQSKTGNFFSFIYRRLEG
jgi:hypothetical protein